jgi:hypothetical protein
MGGGGRDSFLLLETPCGNWYITETQKSIFFKKIDPLSPRD